MRVIKNIRAYEFKTLEDLAKATNSSISFDDLDDLVIKDFDIVVENICTIRNTSVYKFLNNLPNPEMWSVITCADNTMYVINVAKSALYAELNYK